MENMEDEGRNESRKGAAAAGVAVKDPATDLYCSTTPPAAPSVNLLNVPVPELVPLMGVAMPGGGLETRTTTTITIGTRIAQTPKMASQLISCIERICERDECVTQWSYMCVCVCA